MKKAMIVVFGLILMGCSNMELVKKSDQVYSPIMQDVLNQSEYE